MRPGPDQPVEPAIESDAPPPGRAKPRFRRRPGGPLRHLLDDARLALSFLTVLPVGTLRREPGEVWDAPVWFPLVGLGIGAVAGGIRVGMGEVVGDPAATVLALIAFVALTGALHLDGLADSADALGVRGDRERRLAVMRDSAVGAFGVLALIAWALAMFTALASLDATKALFALLAAGAVSRWAALLHATLTGPARPDGLGAGFNVRRVALAAATITAVAVAGLACRLAGIAAVAAGIVVALALSAWARHAIGGRTGDTLGATVAIAEATVCLALVACWT